MELIEITRRILDRLLPERHQTILLALSITLLALGMLQNGEDGGRTADQTEERNSRSTPELAFVGPMLPSRSTSLSKDTITWKEVEEEQRDERLFVTVQPGDNLSLIFKRAGLGPAEVQELTNAGEEAQVLASLYPGDQIAFELDEARELHSLELFKSPLESFLFTRIPSSGFDFAKISRKPHVEIVFKEAIISDSLFLAAQKGGIPASMAMELAGIFNGVVDFILDVRAGDKFNVLYEEEYLDGKFVGNGRILAASFTNQGNTYKALRFENAAGESDFFSPEGESMRKAFLLNPVDFTRISDGFNLARKHPILNTIRAHKGTDYAAPKGTPVVATADGRVSFAARNGSFGKLVVLDHGSRFQTKYAHLNDYAKGIKAGVRVKQGQVIGYVGATGGATGPHLHYEFLMDGVHRNSRTIHDQLPKAQAIAAEDMEGFREQTRLRLSMLETRGASMRIARDGPAVQQ